MADVSNLTEALLVAGSPFKKISDHYQDQRKRADVLTFIQNQISNSHCLEDEDWPKLYQLLLQSVNDSNYKVVINAISCIESLVTNVGSPVCLYIEATLAELYIKLGDTKDGVRNKMLELLQTCFTVMTPQKAFDKLSEAFSHNNWRIKQSNYGGSCIPLVPFLNKSIKLLEDSNSMVREASILALEEIYKYGGEEVKEILKSKGIRPTQLSQIFERLSLIEPISTLSEITIDEESKSKKPLKSTNPTSTKTSVNILDKIESSHKSKPIKIFSDKDLTRETDKIITNLSNPDLDWSIRNEALEKFQRLIFGGATQFPNFMSILQRLKEPLTIQLSDLRSTIVREACETLILLSAVLIDSFDYYSEYFLPVLLKLVINSINVIAEAGHKCIRTILQNTKNDKLLPTIIKNSSNHKLLKFRCIDYVLVLLTELPTNSLEKYQDIIEDNIKARVSDALPEVRSTAKQCYWSYCSHFPERTTPLFNSLDTNVQKHLKDDKNSFKTLPKKPTSNSMPEKDTTLLSSNGKQRTLSAPSLSLGKAMHSAPANNNSATDLRHTTTSVVIPKAIPVKPSTTTTTITSKALRVVDEEPINTAPVVAPPSLSGPKRVAMPTAPVPSVVNNKKLEGGPQRIIMKQEVPLSVPIAAPVNSAASQVTTSAARRVVVPIETTTKPVIVEDTSKLKTALEKVTSSIWSSRVECFSDIKQLLTANLISIENINTADKIIKVCTEHINDPHLKVTIECLETIKLIVSIVSPSNFAICEKLIPLLFKKLLDTKESIKGLSSTIIDTIIRKYEVESISPILFKVLEQNHSKLKLICLEYLTKIITLDASNYLFNLTHMKHNLQKVMNLSAEKTPQIPKILTNYLHILYSKYNECFCAAILELPVNIQLDVISLLSSKVPNINSKFVANAALNDSVFDDESVEDSINEMVENFDSNFDNPTETFGLEDFTTTIPTTPTPQRTYTSPKKAKPAAAQEHTNAYSNILKKLQNVSNLDIFKEGIHKIVELSKANEEEFWRSCVDKLIGALIPLTQASNTTDIRELAILTLGELLKNQKDYEMPQHDIILSLLECYKDSIPEVSQNAEDILDRVAQVAYEPALEVVLMMLNETESSSTLPTLKFLNKIVKHCKRSFLLKVIHMIVPHLHAAFQSTQSDTRKAVVLCIVDIYCKLGEDFQPYLNELPSTQQKLVLIYYNKKKNALP